MRKTNSLIIAGLLYLIMATASGAAEVAAEAVREAVNAYFLGADEPTVEAASWTSEYEFNIGVHDMGNPEHSFARYVCTILRKRGVGTGASVKVIDINTMGSDPDQWEVIGEAVCRG